MSEAEPHHSLRGYDDEFVDAVEDELHCPICQSPLKEAVQTGVCGHRFCRKCLEGHFSRQERDGEPLSCPLDRNNLIRDKDIFPDKATQRKILSFTIKCPCKGCEWTGELRSKQNHLASCPHKVVFCTNENCLWKLPRKDLQKHVTTTCVWRMVPCSYCNVSHPKCHSVAHQSECRRFPLRCPKNCGFATPREEVSAHIEKDCRMAIISCPHAQMGCATEVPRKDMETHLQSDMRLHLDLACKMLSSTQDELRNTQLELRITKELFNDKTGKLEKKISALENKPLRCQNSYTWKISGFNEILTQAKTGRKTRLDSAPLYMGEPGYKVRIRIYPNGFSSGKNTHLSLYIVLIKGDYDSILNWPFRQKISFSLIDQQEDLDDRENIVKSFTGDRGDRRPLGEENTERGFPEFVTHDKIIERRYLVDDTIFIQLQVVLP